MRYRKLRPKLGDVIAVSDDMSLKFEKVAEDISPVWMEAAQEKTNVDVHQGDYISVTEDLWFIYDHNHWRVMTMNEHIEANRQNYFNDLMN